METQEVWSVWTAEAKAVERRSSGAEWTLWSEPIAE